MLKLYIRRLMGVTTVTDAWSSICPAKSFFGLTLDQYREAVKPCYDLRAEMAETRKRLENLTAKCADADAAAVTLTQNIVLAVKADPTEGANSPLYAAMGYVRKSERSGGLRRAQAAASPAPANNKEGATTA